MARSSSHVALSLDASAMLRSRRYESPIDLRETAASKRMFDVAGHYARPDVFKFSVNQNANPIIRTVGGEAME